MSLDPSPESKMRRAHLHCHFMEVFPGLSNHVSQSEDGTQRVVDSLTIPQVGGVHLRENVPPERFTTQHSTFRKQFKLMNLREFLDSPDVVECRKSDVVFNENCEVLRCCQQSGSASQN